MHNILTEKYCKWLQFCRPFRLFYTSPEICKSLWSREMFKRNIKTLGAILRIRFVHLVLEAHGDSNCVCVCVYKFCGTSVAKANQHPFNDFRSNLWKAYGKKIVGQM